MQKRLLDSIPYEGLKNGTHIELEVYYTKGGMNYLAGGTTPRGYYLSVTPVRHEGNCKSFVLFSGRKKLLMEASRYSEKQFEQVVLLGRAAAPELIELVLKEETAA